MATAQASIHPSAVVEDGAVLGAGVSIGPFCHVGAEVRLGDGVDLKSHVVVTGATSIGSATKVYPFASIGFEPQNLRHKGGRTIVEIGARCTIRESVTIHAGSDSSTGRTVIGDDCYLMNYAHVAHDCIVGRNVTFANGATLAGHCEIGDFATLGGLSAVHQFTRIGHHAFVGGTTGVAGDVIPFGMVTGNRARLRGLNVIGMKRSGMPRSEIMALRAAYRLIFDRSRPMDEGLAEARDRFADSPIVNDVAAFLSVRGRRHFTVPALTPAPATTMTRARTEKVRQAGRVGVIAGSGALPAAVLETLALDDQAPLAVLVTGEADAARLVPNVEAVEFRLEDAGGLIALLKTRGVSTLVLAGGIGRRPRIRDFRWSVGLARMLPQTVRALASGDDGLLRAVVRHLEANGISVVGADEIVPNLLAQPGPIAGARPDERERRNIRVAIRAARALGEVDVGQAAVAVGGRVIAVEGIEGTDGLLERTVGLRDHARIARMAGGVLVKCAKPNQERRADLPAIGPKTVEDAHRARLSGIAVEAKKSFVLERSQTIRRAEELGIFIYGFGADGQ